MNDKGVCVRDRTIVVEAVMVSSMNNNGPLPLVTALDSVRARLYSSPEGRKHFKIAHPEQLLSQDIVFFFKCK